jgi:hypothetical protein
MTGNLLSICSTISKVRPEARTDCAGEDQQQFNRPTTAWSFLETNSRAATKKFPVLYGARTFVTVFSRDIFFEPLYHFITRSFCTVSPLLNSQATEPPCSTLKVENLCFSAVRDYLSSISWAILHVWKPCPPSAATSRNCEIFHYKTLERRQNYIFLGHKARLILSINAYLYQEMLPWFIGCHFLWIYEKARANKIASVLCIDIS